jgi:hypothetical protein
MGEQKAKIPRLVGHCGQDILWRIKRSPAAGVESFVGSNVTLSWLAVAGIFAVGVLVGWLIATLRLLRTFQISVTRGSGDSPPKLAFAKTERLLELKCECGSQWKFREGPGDMPPGFRPFPVGASFVCPNCGRSTDLTQVRKLQASALSDLSP